LNPRLDLLQPYPFERLRQLLQGITPHPALSAINLSIGEPKHATPELLKKALTDHLGGLAAYPATAGLPALREAIATWLKRRYQLHAIDPATQVLPVNGSREALFSFAQTVLDPADQSALVVCPNPFYQIYEGAALLGGARPVFLNTTAATNYHIQPQQLDAATWPHVRLMFVCSPGNPAGAVMSLEQWKDIFALADTHGFVIASDECYSELYYDEAHPPLGALQAAQLLGRTDYRGLVVFSSLSKRSNAPGLRSGFVAGDAQILKKFLLYRTYHGGAMGLAVQHASIAAWSDEAHVIANRAAYAAKYRAMLPLLPVTLQTRQPEGGFYLWIQLSTDDVQFTQQLLAEQNVLVLPGSLLARECNGINPGKNHVRVALVAPLAECVEAAHRMRTFISK